MTVLAVFAAVFVLTGLYSLARLSVLAAGPPGDGDRLAELSHLLMSIAMIGMALGWTGGPATASGVLQIAVFGLFAVWFAARIARPDGNGRLGAVYHVVAPAAMIWMVAAMPLLMGGGGSGMAAAHDGHAAATDARAMGGMADPAATAAPRPVWVLAFTIGVVVLLIGAAAGWVVAAVRSTAARQPLGAMAATSADPEPLTTPSAATSAVRTANRVSGSRLDRRLDPRLDASCHALMSLGMAGMLVAMLL